MNTSRKLHIMLYTAAMAAIICVITFFRFPLLGSKVHFANACCLLGALLLGPLPGGLAAAIGSVLYDFLFGGYGFVDCLATFITKFLMAFLCGVLANCFKNKTASGSEVQTKGGKRRLQIVISCVAGALFYVCLYMLKTFIWQRFLYGYPMETVTVTMLSKLPASLINAAAAIIAAPIFYGVLFPVFAQFKSKTGVTSKNSK